MAEKTIIIEVHGGCIQTVHHVPKGFEYDVLDWDNFKEDPVAYWQEMPEETRALIREKYPETLTRWKLPTPTIPPHVQARLEYLRAELRAERISYGELAELADYREYLFGDVELAEAAGITEEEFNAGKLAKP